MEAIINFFTGTLNTVAWLYIFLPCTIVGGLYALNPLRSSP